MTDEREVKFAAVASAGFASMPGVEGSKFIALELDDKVYGFNAEQATAVAVGLLTLALELDPRIRADVEAIATTSSGVVHTRRDPII